MIEYALPREPRVSLNIYDVAGRIVRTLVDRAETPGYYRVLWNGKDETDMPPPAGIYFYKIEAEGYRMVRKLVLMR